MKKVLLVTNSEHGQANVFLAVGHALQALDSDVRIHFCSFDAISSDVSSASEYSVKCTPGAQPWDFHALDGPNFLAAAQNREWSDELGSNLDKPLTFSTTMSMLRIFSGLMQPWTGPEFVKLYKSFVSTVEAVQPDIIAVDSLFSVPLTAIRHLKLKHYVLSPNTLKDFSVALQPRGEMFWKFPVMGTAFEYPVPLRLIPLNTFYCLTLIYYSLTLRSSQSSKDYIKKELGADLVTFEDLLLRPLPDEKVLVANRPEVDFPLRKIPKHLTACGPVIRPVQSVAEVDPELDAWLKRGPTVFICLGTHRSFSEDEALGVADALKQLLQAAEKQNNGAVNGVSGKLQVLWKLKRAKPGHKPTYDTQPGSKVHSALQAELESDQIRIMDWIKPQPAAVLLTGNVVCSINHGGANSFHDALTSGVPQIVLPAWVDCYDFACRAEFLGIGRWGNKQAKPMIDGRELAPILIDVVLGPKSQAMHTKVQELAALCAKSPGVSVAASAILEEMEEKKVQ